MSIDSARSTVRSIQATGRSSIDSSDGRSSIDSRRPIQSRKFNRFKRRVDCVALCHCVAVSLCRCVAVSLVSLCLIVALPISKKFISGEVQSIQATVEVRSIQATVKFDRFKRRSKFDRFKRRTSSIDSSDGRRSIDVDRGSVACVACVACVARVASCRIVALSHVSHLSHCRTCHTGNRNSR